MKRKKAKAKRKKIKMQQKKAHVFNNLILSDQERDLFLKEVENPKPPNRALRQAARRFYAHYNKDGNLKVTKARPLTLDELRRASERYEEITIDDVVKNDGKIDDGVLRSTNDAKVWAEAFLSVIKKNYPSFAASPQFNEILDEGWLIGWFANAMAAQEFKDQKKKMARIAKGLRYLADSIK